MTHDRIGIIGFSHVCIAVSDMEVSLPFYRDVLGLGVFFDLELEGSSMEVVTGEPGARGRMVGGMLGGTVVELLEFAHRSFRPSSETTLGYTNISLSVRDIDEALAALANSRWKSAACGCFSSVTPTAPRSSSCRTPTANGRRPRCGVIQANSTWRLS
jgi:catechol 2,3-dioxygenase-like lactoylglutathione lyase family enzyme